MSVHYFHCTDGVSFFADEKGSGVARDDAVFLGAMARAEAIMQGLPSHDWSGWLVCVHDHLFQIVDVFDFPGLRPSMSMDGTDAAPKGAIRDLICAARSAAPPGRAALQRVRGGRR